MRAALLRRAQLAAGACLAAVSALTGQARAQQTTPFRPERFDEVWPDDADAPFGAQLKNLHVTSDLTLSIGGDGRWRFSALDAPRLGLGGVDADEWMLQRLLLHADLRFKDSARVFVQLGAHESVSREITSPNDDDSLDLQQAFLDLNADLTGARVTLRVGRQELALGPRFVTTRDSGNVRQRHDMTRLIVSKGLWRADLFGGRPTEIEEGVFDDRSDPAEEFYGLRIQRTSDALTASVYAYELDRDDVTLAGLTAHDARASYGVRLSGRRGLYDFDVEALAQTGQFGAQDVTAYALILDASRALRDAPHAPRIGARFTYGSGDADLSDDEQSTFAPAFPNGAWFGQNGLASFSNTVEAAGVLTLTPREDVTLTTKLAAVWRADPTDFLYAGNGPLAGTAGGDAFTGAGGAVSLQWRVSPNLTINPYMSYVAVSDDLRTRGAHDVAYAHVSVSVRF